MPKRKIFILTVVVLTGIFSSFSLYIYQIVKTANLQVDKPDKLIVIEPGTTFDQLRDMLYEEHIVHDVVSFSFIAKLLSYDQAVKPGLYEIKKDMNNLDAIRLLRAGVQTTVMVRFSNARLLTDLAESITRNINLGEEGFLKAVNDFVETNDEGFNHQNIISMFIPNSYEMYYTVSGKGLIEKMLKEYKIFWNEARTAKAAKLNLSKLEVSVLASIVQAESVKPDESKVIAGLYFNRLKQGIRLQADPTLVFASGDFGLKRVLNIHKEADSPYNTYKYAGLPPGPINMPSVKSIDAVLDYEKHDYIYMCAKEDFSGYHNFTASLTQHNANARKYQRQLSIEQRKARALN